MWYRDSEFLSGRKESTIIVIISLSSDKGVIMA